MDVFFSCCCCFFKDWTEFDFTDFCPGSGLKISSNADLYNGCFHTLVPVLLKLWLLLLYRQRRLHVTVFETLLITANPFLTGRHVKGSILTIPDSWILGITLGCGHFSLRITTIPEITKYEWGTCDLPHCRHVVCTCCWVPQALAQTNRSWVLNKLWSMFERDFL